MSDLAPAIFGLSIIGIATIGIATIVLCVAIWRRGLPPPPPRPEFDSTILAVDSDAGYRALHELVQDGWEPVYHWSDRYGTHLVMRRPS